MRFVKDRMGIPTAYFANRWMIDFGRFSLRLHHWTGSDDPEAYHDHASSFFTMVIKGGYDDHFIIGDEGGIDRLRVGSMRFRPALWRHIVHNRFASTWTICVFAAPSRRWSFYPSGKKPMRRDKYFAEIGHHTNVGIRVRLRPDGSLI